MPRQRVQRPLTPDPLAEYDDLRRGSGLIGNMVSFLAVLGLFIVSCWWLFSDISGEYYIPGRNAKSLRMSLVRQATNVYGELTIGNGATLLLVTTDPPRDENVDFVFETPKNRLRPGEKARRIEFSGIFKEGVLDGQFREGTRTIKARLERDGYTSVYRQIESHLPWQLWQKYMASQDNQP